MKYSNWRDQLRLNERRSKVVMILFIFIYLCIGFLIDIVIAENTAVVQGPYGLQRASLGQITHALLTLQITPVATMVAGLVALISLLITYRLYDKIILLGTSYNEVTANATRLEEQQLYNVVEEMKVAAGLKYMPKVFIIEADYMNAFASGYSEKSAMVAITRGLMQKLNRAELQAVMAHELSHIRHHDIKLTLTASVLSNLMLIAIDILFWSAIFSSNRRENNRLIWIVILLRYALPIITMLLMLYLSRTREYMADAGCVELMRDNEPLAHALMKIHNDYAKNHDEYAQQLNNTPHEQVRRASYLYDPSQAGFHSKEMSSMMSTHPSLEQRLRAMGYKRRAK